MKKLIFILTLIFLAACQNIEKVEKPKNLISKEKMVNVIIDLSLFHAAKSYNLRQLENVGINPSEYIYSKHGIDSIQFVQSNNYYITNIEEYQKIYEEVKSELEVLKDHHDSILKLYRKEMESINGNKLPEDQEIRDSILNSRRMEAKKRLNPISFPVPTESN